MYEVKLSANNLRTEAGKKDLLKGKREEGVIQKERSLMRSQ